MCQPVRKFISALIGTFLGVCLAHPAHAGTEADLLDKLERDKTEQNRALITELGQVSKFDTLERSLAASKIRERLNWLIPRATKPDADFRLTYLLAAYLWKFGDKRNTVLAQARADLRSAADEARCEDKTSGPQRLSVWHKASQPVFQLMLNAPPEIKAEIRAAVESETPQLQGRPPSVWMCSGGMQHTKKILQKYPEIASLELSKPIPQEIIDKYRPVMTVNGRSIEFHDDSVLPDFRPEEEWKRALPEIVASFKKAYFQALKLE